MTTIPLEDLAQHGELNFIDTDKIDDLMKLFETHNLLPDLSKNDHIFANALAMLVVSLEWEGGQRHLFKSLPYIKGREIDLLDIINTMTNLGFSSHHMVIGIHEIDDRLIPCLFIPQKTNAAPLVILNRKDGVIRAFHSRKKQIVEFKAKHFKGDAYFFEKNNMEAIEEDRQIKKSAGITWFSTLISRFKPILKQIFLLSFIINLLALAMPLFIMTIYNTVIGSGSVDTLYHLIWGVGLAIIAEGILRIIRSKLVTWMGVRLDNIVSNTIFNRLLLMKAAYTEAASISSQVSRIKAFESVRKFFTGPLFTVIVELPFTIILLIAIWILTGPLVYVPLAVIIIFSLMLFYYQGKMKLAMKLSARASSHRQELGMETFVKMHALHHNGMSRDWWLRYKEKLARASMSSFKTSMISAAIDSASHAISILAGVSVVTYGIHLVWNGSITIGALVATIILMWRVLGPLQTICSMLPRLEQLKNSIGQINKLVNIAVEHEPHAIENPINKIEGHVEINNLGLRYNSEAEPVFVGLDIEAKPGEIVAITGSNASGKSSIPKLINGLYQAQTGTIKIDGINIKQLDPVELRSAISYLPQVPNFFEGTIKENLLLANPLATDEEIIQALKDATAYKEITNMEHGLETKIYAHNPWFPSGYEYQLNLTRALLKKSNLLLFDELPNASLNEEVGKAYKKIIKEAKGKKTMFFVSQRDDFIKLADKVIVLKRSNRPIVITANKFINQYGK